VATLGDVPLYADPEGSLVLGVAPPFTTLKLVAPQDGPLLQVQDPYSDSPSYVRASEVGAVGPPERPDLPGRWWGMLAVDGANLRSSPSTRLAPVGQLPAGVPLIVAGWVEGEEATPDNPTWAQLAGGAFMHSSVLRPVALPTTPPPPAGAAGERGRWIDLNLTYQVIVAYEGRTAVYVARTSTGRPGWLTATGRFPIQRRVEKETMESATLIGLDAQRADYKVENVRWTQYFTSDGMAVHENYWKPRDQFGVPSSHGCAGLVAEDARFFWDWASLGTPIYSHY
jgi:lipoprotein-anchoring transpeptidase ErfK/SrfK